MQDAKFRGGHMEIGFRLKCACGDVTEYIDVRPRAGESTYFMKIGWRHIPNLGWLCPSCIVLHGMVTR